MDLDINSIGLNSEFHIKYFLDYSKAILNEQIIA